MENFTSDQPCIRVGIVDDHYYFLKGIVDDINSFEDFEVTIKAYSGEELLILLKNAPHLPDVLLVDISLTGINGIETTKRIKEKYSSVKVIAISVDDDDWTMAWMLIAGACAYLRKDVRPDKLRQTLLEVHKTGEYKADLFALYGEGLRQFEEDIKNITFTKKETQFLSLLCKGYNFTEIASEMHLSVRTLDYHNERICTKLNTNRQTLIILQALRMKISQLHEPKIWSNTL